MAVFMLECDAVSEVGSSLSSLVSKISDISSSVSGYDTSCEDGFDFASAKSVIASNIEACSTKVQNTAQLIENVVSSHTSLQGSLKFDGGNGASSTSGSSGGSSGSSSGRTSGSHNTVDSEHSTAATSKVNSSQRTRTSSPNSSSTSTSRNSNTSASTSTRTTSSSNTGGSTSTRTASSSNTGGSTSTRTASSSNTGGSAAGTTSSSVAGATVISGATAVSGVASKVNNTNKSNASGSSVNNRPETGTIISKVNHIKVGDITNNIIENMKYNKDGYGFIGSKHVIACDKSLGNIGDAITIKQSDGTTVECVIGRVTNNRSTISFYVNSSNVGSNKAINNITNSAVKIVNKGQISSSVVSGTKVLSNNKSIEVLGEERDGV